MTEGRVPFDGAWVRRVLELAPEGGADGAEPRRYAGVAVDSRRAESGRLFAALPGERRHGVEFLAEAAARGAPGALVPTAAALPEGLRVPEGLEAADGRPFELFRVPDTLRALGELARARRREAGRGGRAGAAGQAGTTGVEVVGVTGSSGKTTVKEMIHRALSGARTSYRTAGNLNSLSGLPIAVFDAPPEADVWVLEMGANEPGEIARLAQIAAPDHAVVTTVGPAHLERFGDVATVMREKLALVEAAAPGGAVVVGERPPELGPRARELRPDALVAGVGEGADVAPERHAVEAERVWFERNGVRYEVAAGGLHHLRDALLAVAVAEALGVPPADAARGLRAFRPLDMRGALRRVGGLTVLVDCYNANPESFEAAIEYCASAFPDRRLAAVVGTMLELGDASEAAHERVARRLRAAGFDLVGATGAFAAAAGSLGPTANGGTRFLRVEDPEAVFEPLAEALHGDEVVLVKASRGVRLERIVPLLEERFGSGSGGRRTGSSRALGRAEPESRPGGARPPPGKAHPPGATSGDGPDEGGDG